MSDTSASDTSASDTSVSGTAPASDQSSDPGFGPAAAFLTDAQFIAAVSPDKKAITATFGNFTLELTANSSQAIVKRDFSFTIPFKAGAPDQEIFLTLQGFMFAEKGVNGHLILCANGQTSFIDFAEVDDSILHHVKVAAGTGSELQVTIILVLARDSKSNAQANLSISSIDMESPPPENA